jgi:hypothetical protein
VGDLQVAVREHRCPRPERGLGDLAVAGDQVGGRTPFVTSHSHSPSRSRCDLVEAPAGPWRQRRVVQHPDGGTRRGPRRRRRGRRLAEAAECRPREGGEREHGRLAPQDLRGRDRRQGHRLDLDVDARLIGVDLQEHVADAQGRALGWATTTSTSSTGGHYRGDDRRRRRVYRGGGADGQLLGDLRVARAPGDGGHDLALAAGEPFQAGRGDRVDDGAA